MAVMKNSYKILWEDLKGSDYLEDLDVGGLGKGPGSPLKAAMNIWIP
jgi:hypothetical protein